MTVYLILSNFGACTGYLIIIADSLTPVFHQVFDQYSFSYYIANRIATSLIISVLFILPLALQRKMHHLRFSSTLSIFCVTYIVFIIIYKSTGYLKDVKDKDILYANTANIEPFSGIALMSFALNCHFSMPLIYVELKYNQIVWRIQAIVIATMTICGILYCTTAIFGYLSFLGDVKDNILLNYANDDGIVNSARILLTLVMICHFPVVSFSCRSALDYLLFQNRPDTAIRSMSETLLIWAACYLVALAVPYIKVVLGLVGSVPLSSFIFPAFLLWKLRKHKMWTGLTGAPAFIMAITLFVVSGIMSVLCTGSVLLDMIK